MALVGVTIVLLVNHDGLIYLLLLSQLHYASYVRIRILRTTYIRTTNVRTYDTDIHTVYVRRTREVLGFVYVQCYVARGTAFQKIEGRLLEGLRVN